MVMVGVETSASAETSGRRLRIAGGGVLLVLAFAYFAGLSPYGLSIDDEGTLLYQIYRTYLGQVLYIDFHG